MDEFQVIGLDHVQLAMPQGGEAAARGFYHGALSMAEVAKPAALAGRGGCWFTGGGVNLHLGVEDPFTPAQKAHPALVVDDLATAHAGLREHGVTAISALPGLHRFFVADPFGNRIEIVAFD